MKNIFLLLFFWGEIVCFAQSDRNKPYYSEYPIKQDVLVAYDSFNEYLLDKDRNIYYRDTNKSDAVGAIWTQAIYWDMAMNAYKREQEPKYKKLVEDLFEGNYEHYAGFDWDNGEVWFIYDDIMWWVISLARAYEMTLDRKYLRYAESGFLRVWSGSEKVGDQGSYDSVNGGMYWHWDQKNPSVREANSGKMACINYPTVIAAMTLYNTTQKEEYLHRAKDIYEWSRKNIFNIATGMVADSKHGNNIPDWTATVYNQATCIGAAVMLYKASKDEKYLNDAIASADYTFYTLSNPQSILPYKEGEEQGVYTAIFAQYIVRLVEDCNKPEYYHNLCQTINNGWNLRDKQRNLTTKNYLRQVKNKEVISCYDASGIPALMLVVPSR